MEMIVGFVLASTAFLPGILLLIALSKKLRTSTSFLERILFGSVLWTYLLVSLSVIFGTSAHSLTAFYKIFNLISMATAVGSLIYITRNQQVHILNPVRRAQKFLADPLNLLYVIGLSLLFLVCFLALYFHTFFAEWDAISDYIPSAKAILVTEGLTTQPYGLLNFCDVSPGIPVVYSWLLDISDMDSLYNLSLIYFLLTLIAIFLISRKAFSRQIALTSVPVFMSLPTVTVLLGSRSLYLDMPFVMYFLVTLYSMMRILDNRAANNNSFLFDYMILAMGTTQLALIRIEFGIFMLPTIAAVIVFALRPAHWEIILGLTMGLTFYLREARNVVLNSFSWVPLQRITPILMGSAILFVFMKRVSSGKIVNEKAKEKKLFLLAFLLILPFTIYMLRNIVVYGFIVPGLPVSNSDIVRSVAFFSKVTPSSIAPCLMDFLRWDYLATVWWLTPAYLVPTTTTLALSLFLLAKKRKVQSCRIAILISLVGVFLLWSTLSCDPQPRRLYYFAPFLSVIAAYGLSRIGKFYTPLGFGLRVPTYVISIACYTLTKMQVKTVNDLAALYATLYTPQFDLEFTAVSAFLFLLIFMPYEMFFNKIRKKAGVPKKVFAAVCLSLLCLNLIVFSISVGPIIMAVTNSGFQSRVEYDGKGWLHYPDVVAYYNENITDNCVTLGYYCHDLTTFANRSVIDLSNPVSGVPMYSMLDKMNSSEILNRMKQLNVRYFLRPKTNNPFFLTYEKTINSTMFGSVLLNNPQFRALGTFKYVTLYKFYENYTVHALNFSEIEPWNYEPCADFAFATEPNLIRFSGTTNNGGDLAIMYYLENPMRLDSLWITMRSYIGAKLIAVLYNDVHNRTTSFFYYYPTLTSETTSFVIGINEGQTIGEFDPNNVQGILVGIKSKPNHKETFDVISLLSLSYETK